MLLSLFFLIITFVLGLIFSNVKINIKLLEIENLSKKFNFKYNINLGFLLFGKIKILGLNLLEDGIEFQGKKMRYSKVKENKLVRKLLKEDLKVVERNFEMKDLKEAKFKLEKLDFKLDLGFENVLLTVFMIPIISTLLSFVVKNNVNKYDSTKYKYVIMPQYRNSNIMHLKASSIITVKTVHIIHVILNNKKRSVNRNERSSYRGAYGNSNGQY